MRNETFRRLQLNSNKLTHNFNSKRNMPGVTNINMTDTGARRGTPHTCHLHWTGHVAPNSPDLYPVDDAICGALQERVYHRRKFNSVDQLKQAIVLEWRALSDVVLETNVLFTSLRALPQCFDWRQHQWMETPFAVCCRSERRMHWTHVSLTVYCKIIVVRDAVLKYFPS